MMGFRRSRHRVAWITTLWVKTEEVELKPGSIMTNVNRMNVSAPEGATYISVDLDTYERLLVEAGYDIASRKRTEV